jgi:SAM-dependent methyltransferase
MTATGYVHGYHDAESRRLTDQAGTLAGLLHHGTDYPSGTRVLEVGCGVGAQTVHLLRRNPGIVLDAVDVRAASLAAARARVAADVPGAAVRWHRADLFDLPFGPGTFDEVFVCFVLEHLAEPVEALAALRRMLRPGGGITVIEGDHGSAFFHPDGAHARRAVECLVRLQAGNGGDALLGRRLYPLLSAGGYHDVRVEPRTVYVDDSRPDLVEGFTLNTFTAMVAGVGADAVAAGLMPAEEWALGIAELERTARPGGTFHYTFFKARAHAGG